MKIEFERSGGFAAIDFRATIDTDELDIDEAHELEELVAASGFFTLPDHMPAPATGVDRFQYRLSIRTEGRRHTVQVDESAAPEPLGALLNRLTLLARSHR